MRIFKLLSFFFLLLPLQTVAEIYDVSTTAELREALASAAAAGGDNTIRLAAGTYSTQDDGEGRFEYLSTIAGTLSLLALNPNEKPVLDGAGQDRILELYGPNNALSLTVESLKFQNAGDGAINNLQTEMVDVVISDSEFSNNTRDYEGGAIFFYFVDSWVISDSIFDANKSTRFGGAVRVYNVTSFFEITNTVFRNNEARIGGAVAAIAWSKSGLIDNCRFEGNSATNGAGAADLRESGTRVTNSFFEGNSVKTSGAAAVSGGILVGNTFTNHLNQREEGDLYPHEIITGATIANNFFSFNDSGVAKPSLTDPVTNNLFHDMSLWVDDGAKITNNIFLDDVGGIRRDGDDPYEIFLNNNYIDQDKLDSWVLVDGSDNIFEGVNLGFVNAEEGDYRLTSSSGLIDAGTTDPELAYITDYDYTGTTARVIGASIDIGPYEYDGEAPPSISRSFNVLLQAVQDVRGAGRGKQAQVTGDSSSDAGVARQLAKQEGTTAQAKAMSTAGEPAAIPAMPHYLMLMMVGLVSLLGLRRLRA